MDLTSILPVDNTRRWTIPTQVYLLRNVSSVKPLYKIGCSSYPSKRRNSMASQFKAEVELIASFHAGRCWADTLEAAWHRCFWPQRAAQKGPLSREWFYLSKRDVALFIFASEHIARALKNIDDDNWGWVHGALKRVDLSNMRALAERVQFTYPRDEFNPS